jgi:ERF superfamily protein
MPEPCKTLAEALAALQARLPRVAKEHTAKVETKTGGNYKYAYADLTDVSEAILPVLASLGLSFTARPTLRDSEQGSFGRFVLVYDLWHTSGGSIGGWYPLPDPDRLGPQDLGKAITYARRYALCAVTGLAPGGDDDDAQAAEAEHVARLRRPVSAQDKERAKTSHLKAGTSRMARAQEGDPWAQDAPVDHDRAAALREGLPAEEQPGTSQEGQWKTLAILYSKIGLLTKEARYAEMADRCGREITSAKDLSYAEAEQAIRALRDLAKTYQQEQEAGGADS